MSSPHFDITTEMNITPLGEVFGPIEVPVYHSTDYKKAFRPREPKLRLKQFAVEFRGEDIDPIVCPNKSVVTVIDPDALSLAASYRSSDGSRRLVMWQRINPSTGLLEIKLPKRYMSEKRSEDRFGIAVNRLSDKMNVEPVTVPSMSVCPMIVFPGTLPIVISQFSCSIHPPTIYYQNKTGHDVSHYFRDRHYGFTEVISVPTRSILADLFRGDFRDPHAFLAAVEIEDITFVHETLPDDLKNAVQSCLLQKLVSHQIANASKLDSLVWESSPPPVPTSMKATRIKSFKDAYFKIKDRTFQHYDCEGNIIHNVHVESIQSKEGLHHQVVMLAYVKAKDGSGRTEYYVLVNLGNREQAVRALSNNLIQTEKTNTNVEPFSFWSSSVPTNEEIRAKFFEYSGLNTIGEPTSIGSFAINEDYAADFISDCFLIEVDVSTFKPQAPYEGLYQTFIPLNEMKKALRNGTIRNIPLAVATDVIGAASKYQFDDIKPFRLESDAQAFRQMMLRGSHYRDFLEENFSLQFQRLNKSSTFRRILEEVFNHGFGLKDNGDQFYSCLVEYGMRDELPQLERFILLLHDWYHGIQGDLIPWEFSNDSQKMISLDDYLKGVLTNEGLAVFFSDVFLARRYGHENWKNDGSSLSLGEALYQCGVTKANHQRAVTIALVRDGIIPESIKSHPSFDSSKSPIEYYRSYHDRDTNIGIQAYEYWKDHPEVARTVLMFNERCRSKLSEHNATIKSAVAGIRAERSRGLNPLRHELFELKDVTIFKLALRLSYIADITKDVTFRENLLAVRDNLYTIRKELNDLDKNIHGFHPSEGNINAFNRIRMLAEDVAETEQTMKSYLLTGGYTQESIDTLFTRIPLWAAPFEVS
jgi:hypothetical protein